MMNPRSDWTQQLGSIGFDSVAVFTEALTQWLDAHKPALQMCADVALYRAGGMVRVSSADLEKQQMFLAPLVPRSSLDLPATRNPSLMFQLSGHFLFSLGDHLAKVPGFRHDWDRGAPIRTAMDERYADHPLYAGVLPVLISVAGLQLSQILYFPHFLPDPTSSPSEAILNAEQRIVAGDILHLVQSSVNAGFPIRQIGQEFSVPAVPGRYVRARGAWTWEKLFADWSDYRRGQHQGLDETLDGLTSGFSPRELMLAMKSWAFWYGTPPT